MKKIDLRTVSKWLPLMAFISSTAIAATPPPSTLQDSDLPLPALPMSDPFSAQAPLSTGNNALSQPTSSPSMPSEATPVKPLNMPPSVAPEAQPIKSAPEKMEKENAEDLTTVSPATPPLLERSKVEEVELTPADQFMKSVAWEAVSSSQDWRKRWYAANFGQVSIYSVLDLLHIPRGTILPWRHDAQGVPEVVLHAIIKVPNLQRVLPTNLEQPLEEVSLDIRQYVTFYYRNGIESEAVQSGNEPFVVNLNSGESTTSSSHQNGTPFPYYSGVILKRDGWAVPASTSYSASPYYADSHPAMPGSSRQETVTTTTTTTTVIPKLLQKEIPGGWMASASPYYITRIDKNSSVSLLDVKEGKGAWNAQVGHGGLLVKDFVEGGLAAARTQLVRTFRDEEIQWFLKGNSDVLFYLRPQ